MITPVYNERKTLRTVVDRVLSVPLDTELKLRVLLQPENMGRGAALRRGIQEVSGDFVVIQDADLEYDPSEYPDLLDPLIQGQADVVYGSRFLGSRSHIVVHFWHSVVNRLLTLLPNCLTNINLSDRETSCKMFRREIIQSIPIEENRFGFEPESRSRWPSDGSGSMSRHQLLWSNLRRRQEDRLEGRVSVSLVLVEILDQRTRRRSSEFRCSRGSRANRQGSLT